LHVQPFEPRRAVSSEHVLTKCRYLFNIPSEKCILHQIS